MSVKGAVQDVKYLTDLEEERGFRAATSLIGDSHIVIVNPGISDDQINSGARIRPSDATLPW